MFPSSLRLIELAAALAFAVMVAPPAGTSTPPALSTLKLATWNLEWLMTPATFNELKARCTDNDRARRAAQRAMPCDVASSLERSALDLAALSRYARQLDADVVALQEVDGPAAARLVFPLHEFCFTGSRALQNNGFAIRRGVPFRCDADVTGLSQGDVVRRGAVAVLFPGTPQEIHLLGVHLKSGCARQALDGPDDACARLARQARPLEDWIDAQARAGRRFAILGDFNRDLLAERGPVRNRNGSLHSFWHEISDGDPRGAALLNTAAGETFRNCAPGQNHTSFIDYILLGGPLRERWVAGSFERMTWQPRDAARLRLSDHCPVAIRLRL